MREELMTDAEVDREIQKALAVDPSPGFAARVRTRLASEPEPSGWWVWILAGAGVLATAVILTVVVPRPPETTASRTENVWLPPAPRQDVRAQVPASPVTVEPSPPSVRARVLAQPQVVVPPTELEGLQRMIAAVRDGRFQIVLAPSDPIDIDIPLVLVPDIAIAPITIAPISE